jgi:predicted HTH transcriptional regulator
MEIQSPGTLPLGMTIDDFKAGLSRIRNRVIARVFRELGLMEEWGSGYRRVSDSCNRAGYPVPEWQEVGPSMRVTIFPHPEVREQLIDVPVNVPINVPVNERQAWFIEQLRNGRNCKASDLAAQWQIAEKTAKRDIGDLKKKGLISFVFQKREKNLRFFDVTYSPPIPV